MATMRARLTVRYAKTMMLMMQELMMLAMLNDADDGDTDDGNDSGNDDDNDNDNDGGNDNDNDDDNGWWQVRLIRAWTSCSA